MYLKHRTEIGAHCIFIAHMRALDVYISLIENIFIASAKVIYKPYSEKTSVDEITSRHTKMVNYALFANLAYNSLVGLATQNALSYTKIKDFGDYKLYYRPLLFSEIMLTSGLWEVYVKRMLKIASDDVFVDVGAHIGSYTIPVAKKAQKVIAFEPNKYSFELLKKNISVNHLTNVAAYNIAVSKKSGSSLFSHETEPVYSRIIDGDESSNITVIENTKGRDNNIHVVNTIDLDSVLLKEDTIDWIKIDVEGHELDVLEGAVQSILMHKPKIIIELMSGNLQKMKTMAHNLGYSIEHIYRDYFLLKPTLYGS
jgi:FkbM family methyltransferase